MGDHRAKTPRDGLFVCTRFLSRCGNGCSHCRAQMSGRKAQAMGALFEDLFSRGCRRVTDIAITRFPDGCRQVGNGRLFRVQTPWDWSLTHHGRTAFIDTKTVAGSSFPHSSIEEHQVRELAYHERAGAIAGYVFWFRDVDVVSWLKASVLDSLRVEHGSIPFGSTHSLGKIADFNPRKIFDASHIL